jgi:hypothetical protein
MPPHAVTFVDANAQATVVKPNWHGRNLQTNEVNWYSTVLYVYHACVALVWSIASVLNMTSAGLIFVFV